MKQTNKSDRFRRYLNRACWCFWVLLLALVVRTCNQPATPTRNNLEPETPAIWETDPTAGIVLEPVSEEAEQ